MLRILTALALCFLAAMPGLAQTAKLVPQSRAEVTLSFAPVVKRAAPGVVNVYAKTLVAQRETDMFAIPSSAASSAATAASAARASACRTRWVPASSSIRRA